MDAVNAVSTDDVSNQRLFSGLGTEEGSSWTDGGSDLVGEIATVL